MPQRQSASLLHKGPRGPYALKLHNFAMDGQIQARSMSLESSSIPLSREKHRKLASFLTFALLSSVLCRIDVHFYSYMYCSLHECCFDVTLIQALNSFTFICLDMHSQSSWMILHCKMYLRMFTLNYLISQNLNLKYSCGADFKTMTFF